MIPADFEYHAPQSVREAVDLLSRLPDAKVLGGGMSLIPSMKHRLATPAAVVDVSRLSGLQEIREKWGSARIGAGATHGAIARSDELADHPIFRETARVIGDVQVRNRGTIGGSLVHADPAADWPALLLALDGEVRALGPKGERKIAADEFFAGMLTSALEPDEVATEVRLPLESKRAGAAYRKLRQPASGFAVVGVAARVELDRKGRCKRVGVGITGINSIPFRARSLEAKLEGEAPDAETLARACAAIEELDPTEDPHASAEYRRHLASVYARRALAAAAERAAG